MSAHDFAADFADEELSSVQIKAQAPRLTLAHCDKLIERDAILSKPP